MALPLLSQGEYKLQTASLAVLADMFPPWRITAFLTMASPNPVPPSLRERPLSTR